MSRRKRRRQEKKRSKVRNVRRQPRERLLPVSKTAKASKYLHHLKKYYKQHPDMIAILYNRESSRSQKDNHITNEKVLQRKCKKLGIPVLSFYYETISGKITNEDRLSLVQAVRKAKAKINEGKHAVILASSSDRFLRNGIFNPITYPDILPTEAEFEKLKKLTRGIPLITLLRPNMPPGEVRGYQTKWGQKSKGSKIGRPKVNKPGYKKKRRDEKLQQVIQLRRDGASWGEISAKTGIPKTTAAGWVKKYD